MAYATLVDLQNVGMPPQSFGETEGTQITTALQNASDFADAFFRARYGSSAVPLVSWDTTITEAVAKIAAWRILNMRGINPNSSDFELLRTGYNDAVDYLNKIQRQQAHPSVTLAATGLPGSTQPNVISSSVVNLASGGTATNRGW